MQNNLFYGLVKYVFKNNYSAIVLSFCIAFSIYGHADNAYYSVGVRADIITVSTTILYAQDTPYISLGEMLHSLGGVVRITPDQVQANYSGITAVLKTNDVAVSVPGLTFALIHPARVHGEDLYLSQADIADFFARAYQTRITQADQTAAPPMLTPITPDEPLLDEEPGQLLEELALLPVDEEPIPEEPEDDPVPQEEMPPPSEELTAEGEEEAPPSLLDQASLAGLSGIIVLDAGHGGQDGGAAGGDGTVEKDFVLGVTMNLRRILKETTQLTIHLTRDSDKEISLGARAKAANDAKCAMLVSLHAGYSARTQTAGVTLFTDQTPSLPENTMTAESRQQLATRRTHGERAAPFAYRVAQTLATENRMGAVTVRTAPLILQNLSEMPCLMIELIYLSNPESAVAATDEAYREQVAQSLANAIAVAMKEMAG